MQTDLLAVGGGHDASPHDGASRPARLAGNPCCSLSFSWGVTMNHCVEIAVAGRASDGVLPRASRVDLVERLWAAAEAQVGAHEARLKGLGPGEAASEAHAKALATLARTIRELIDLDGAAIEVDRALEDQDNPHDLNPDSALTDLASLREELARRLEGLEPGPEDAAAGGADSG
jgi:hypothetical protein